MAKRSCARSCSKAPTDALLALVVSRNRRELIQIVRARIRMSDPRLLESSFATDLSCDPRQACYAARLGMSMNPHIYALFGLTVLRPSPSRR